MYFKNKFLLIQVHAAYFSLLVGSELMDSHEPLSIYGGKIHFLIKFYFNIWRQCKVTVQRQILSMRQYSSTVQFWGFFFNTIRMSYKWISIHCKFVFLNLFSTPSGIRLSRPWPCSPQSKMVSSLMKTHLWSVSITQAHMSAHSGLSDSVRILICTMHSMALNLSYHN